MARTVRQRLQQAAVELFAERGFDGTTAAEIAAAVGVTERTFFRHFADKREALFDGQAVLTEGLTEAIRAAPDDRAPMDTLFDAFHAVIPLLEANRAFSVPRHAVIAATPALQEREVAKSAALAEALAGALRDRGVPDQVASLAAGVGMTVFAQVTVAWLHDPGTGLARRLDAARDALRSLT